MNEDRPAQTDIEAHAHARLGAVLKEKYRLDRILGFGAMGTVYAATHRNGKEVALKLLHPELAGNEDIRSRFLCEGYVANQVRHSGAVAILDDDVTEEGWAFLVMELLDGVTVEEFWEARDARIDAACVCALTLQLLDVMVAAHEHGIVHRDLKPANLFLLPTGELKVLDFGVACLRTAARTSDVGAVMGTPEYMAPEQALGRVTDIDARTDLWAIGAVAFGLLVGEVVHPCATVEETLLYAATRQARSLASLATSAPPSVARVLDRALLFNRSARWADAREMRNALARAAIEAYGEVPGPPALHGALMRRMMGGCAREREALEPAMNEVHTPWTPTVPTMRATLLGLPRPSRSSDLAIGAVSKPVMVGTPTMRTRKRVRRLSPAAGMAAIATASLTLLVLLSHVVSSARVQAFAPSPRPAPPAVVVSDWRPVVATPIPPAILHPVDVPETLPPPERALTYASPPRAPEVDVARRVAAVPVSSRVAAPRRAACSPPYWIDATRNIKRWKLDCF